MYLLLFVFCDALPTVNCCFSNTFFLFDYTYYLRLIEMQFLLSFGCFFCCFEIYFLFDASIHFSNLEYYSCGHVKMRIRMLYVLLYEPKPWIKI